VDLNGDGYSDILSGSYSRMEQPMAGLFQVLWGQKGGGFQKAVVLQGTDGEPLIIPRKDKDDLTRNICTRPTAVDWNGDGKLDLVVGNFAGTFFLFVGEGGGKFRPEPQPVRAGEFPLAVPGHHGDPFVVDWDGDGDLDLLSGSSEGGVYWAENVAGRGNPPELKPFKPLIEPGPKIEYGKLLSEEELTGPLESTRVWAEDVNGDGKLDLLVGDNVTLISTADGVSQEDYAKSFAKWKEDCQAASKNLNFGTGDPEARNRAYDRYRKVYDERTAFMKEERTGYVWLFLRK
jgi:FG-GAP-like repeat